MGNIKNGYPQSVATSEDNTPSVRPCPEFLEQQKCVLKKNEGFDTRFVQWDHEQNHWFQNGEHLTSINGQIGFWGYPMINPFWHVGFQC